MQSIKEQIKQNSIKGAYLLYGEEDFLKDYYCQSIVDLCTKEGPVEFNFMKINSDKLNTDEITEFAVSTPFMADKKVLLIKNSGIFSKANESVKKYWSEFFSHVPPHLVIVFCENNVDKRSALYKAISKDHTAEEFPLCKENELVNWFANVLAKNGKSMTKDDICFVIENVGRNMYLLMSEAQKLISFARDKGDLISHDDIEKCICKSIEGKVFELIDNIVLKNKEKVIAGIEDLKTLREQPVLIVSLIYKNFSALRKIKTMEKETVFEIAKKTKLRDFVVKKNLSLVKRFSLDALNKAVILCNQTDKDIKSGACEPWLAVERLAVELMIGEVYHK